METIKTASMVIVLMAIGYGVYTVLNQPQQVPPGVPQGDEITPLSIDVPQFSTGTNSAIPEVQPLTANSDSLAPPYASNANVESQPSNTNVEAPSFNTNLNNPASSFNNADSASLTNPAAATPAAPDFSNVTTPNFDQTALSNPGANAPAASSAMSSSAALSKFSSVGQENPQGSNSLTKSFELDWQTAKTLLENNELAKALKLLTPWRNRPELNTQQNEELNRLLSQLAGTVVYSTDHLLLEAHTVAAGETLEQIANQYQVSSVLLQKINGIADPQSLTTGEKIKVLQGPFMAKVDLFSSELVLTVDGCYAGRFPLSTGTLATIKEGDFQVVRKEEDPDYFDPQAGQLLSASDPNNPYGKFVLHLDGGMSIHGSQSAQGGSISLGQRDIEDVFGILTVGSQVKVVR